MRRDSLVLGRTVAPLALSALLTALPLAAQRGSLSPPADLDQHVRRVMERFQVPGVALAIVKDGRVVVAAGYGVRTLGEPAVVDAHTRFGIASNTKAFTATALGLLVEDGVIEWDTPVIEYLPWFRMWDPWVTQEITVRDLLVHRSGLGLGQGDLLGWPPSTRSREEIVRRIRHLQPVTSFRSSYAYDNILYHVAALVIEAMSGMRWEEFVESRILVPIGMTETKVSRASVHDGGNVATPHAPVLGAVQAVTPFDATNTNASGGINSTATDMAKWLLVQLDSGRVSDDERLFSPRTTRELWTPVTPMPITVPRPELDPLHTDYRGYGLGFVVQEYRGWKFITHTGGLPGYVSRVSMIPDLRLGLAVLTNQESRGAFEAITHRILDHYLDARDTGWLTVYESVLFTQDSALANMRMGAPVGRDTLSKPSLPLERYAQTYIDAWYGEVEVSLDEGALVIRFTHTPLLVGDLEHWQHDTFIARWRARHLRADAFVTFALTSGGEIEQVKMRAVSPLTDFSFDFQDLLLRPVRR